MNEIIQRFHKDPFAARSFCPLRPDAPLTPEDWTRLSGPEADLDQVPAGMALNTAFPAAEERVRAFLETIRKPRLRLTLVGLGDVGGTLLTTLKLLGEEISEIGIYDPNEALCRRYELELNQILDRPEPRIVLRRKEDLFACDVFLFTASLGVPPIGAAGDVRMVQLAKNREMLKEYSALARRARFSGLFCEISDPVDLLARSVYLQSNRDEAGNYDFRGLLPEQVVGFGLGVMRARAANMARRMGADCPRLRAFGPHGADLVVANDPLDYDEALSQALTRRTVEANLEVRALGFKPYIAPAISSAALSLLRLLRGEPFLGAVPMGGVYFGCRNQLTEFGFETLPEPLHPALRDRVGAAWEKLREAEPLCRA